MEPIVELFGIIPALKAGEMGAAGAVVMIAVRLYRMIPGAPWPSEKWKWLVQLSTFLLSFLVALLVGALAGGVGWGAAAITAIGIAASAITGHEVTKAVGQAVRAPKPPSYKPSPFGAAASLVIPAPKLRSNVSLKVSQNEGQHGH